MRNLGKIAILCLVVGSFVWPVPLARPSIPNKPIFEHIGDGFLTFYNTHTGEIMDIEYKDEDNGYIEDGLEKVDYILRCRMTDQKIRMNLELIELVDNIEDHFGGERVEVISGYRSPELNGTLRSSGHGVASRSLHLTGEAMDIRIPGIPIKELRDYAVSLKAGGVGYYPGPQFVHVDVGPVRHW